MVIRKHKNQFMFNFKFLIANLFVLELHIFHLASYSMKIIIIHIKFVWRSRGEV